MPDNTGKYIIFTSSSRLVKRKLPQYTCTFFSLGKDKEYEGIQHLKEVTVFVIDRMSERVTTPVYSP